MSAGNRFELREADVVGTHSQHVNDVKDQIFDQLRQLIGDLEPMSSEFQGAAGTAFQNLKAEYEGLIKSYKRPFTPEQHDALTDADYIMVVWKGGKIVPVAQK